MTSSRTETVVGAIRDLILAGEFPTGAKVTEVGIAERLGVSRTPVRLAFQQLQGEGLLNGEPNKGFTVRLITEKDVLAGFDVRGMLEGMASRLVAEAGLRRADEAALRKCVERGDIVMEIQSLTEDVIRIWTESNLEFHRLIVEAAENPMLLSMHELVSRHPLVGPASIAVRPSMLGRSAISLASSQQQHRVLFDAIREGQGTRAEHLAREHIYTAREAIGQQIFETDRRE